MTLPQAMILLLFENLNQYTLAELCSRTGLTFEYICSSIKALVDFKILKVNTTVSFTLFYLYSTLY